MLLAERVADFAQDGAHAHGSVVTYPETDRVEHVAKHAGKGIEDDLAARTHAFAREQLADPWLQGGAVARAMIAVEKAHGGTAVVRQAQRFDFMQARQRQSQRHRRVRECIEHGPRAPVHDAAVNHAWNLHVGLPLSGGEFGGAHGGS